MEYILRTWKDSDVQSLATHLNNKKIWDNCRDGLPFPYTEKDAIKFITYATKQPTQNGRRKVQFGSRLLVIRELLE